MKLRTLAALVVVAHALVHPAVHTLPVIVPGTERAQAPATSPLPGLQLNKGQPCPACRVERDLPANPLLVPTAQPPGPPVWLPLLTPVLSSSALTRPARAPPAPSAVAGPLA